MFLNIFYRLDDAPTSIEELKEYRGDRGHRGDKICDIVSINEDKLERKVISIIFILQRICVYGMVLLYKEI